MKGKMEMKIIKVTGKNQSAYTGIMSSMDSKKEFPVCNSLDACGCTGNGNC